MNTAVFLLERAYNNFPENIAIEDTKGHITYREYRDISRKIAVSLMYNEYKNCPVVIFLDKNIKCLTSFMGARYSSRPYVPVDINMPAYRIQKIIDSLKPCTFITDRTLIESLNEVSFDGIELKIYEDITECGLNNDINIEISENRIDNDIAYIIYTSGSTGMPKGAMRPDKGISDWLKYVEQIFHFNSNTVMASITPFYYEMSNFDVYYSLYCGAKLLIIPAILVMHPRQFLEYLKEKKVNSIFSVPSVLANIANSHELEKIELPDLKNVMFSGEVMSNRQLNIWRRALPDIIYTNIYGTSETSFITFYNIERQYKDTEPLPVGKNADYLKCLILKDDDSEAKMGEEGQLCFSGSTVSSKYWNNEELSKNVFVKNPLNPNELIYKTGDCAYLNEIGEICFKTRKDFQIKRRGHRIELGEIEHAALNIEGVMNAAAIYESESEDIILFIETKIKESLHPFNIKMLNYIPKYMLPTKLICMEKLFYKANGKMDRVKLKYMLNEQGEEYAGKN